MARATARKVARSKRIDPPALADESDRALRMMPAAKEVNRFADFRPEAAMAAIAREGLLSRIEALRERGEVLRELMRALG